MSSWSKFWWRFVQTYIPTQSKHDEPWKKDLFSSLSAFQNKKSSYMYIFTNQFTAVLIKCIEKVGLTSM